MVANKSRVPNQNGISQAWYVGEIYHSGGEPSKWMCVEACPPLLKKRTVSQTCLLLWFNNNNNSNNNNNRIQRCSSRFLTISSGLHAHMHITHTHTHACTFSLSHCLLGQVVKVFTSRAEDPRFESCLHQDFFQVESYQWLKNWHSSGYRLHQHFSRSNHTSDLEIGTPVVILHAKHLAL